MGESSAAPAQRVANERVLRRVKDYLDEACELDNPRSRGKALTGDLPCYRQYRVGDYRILVEVRDDDLVIIAITLGHRSGVY